MTRVSPETFTEILQQELPSAAETGIYLESMRYGVFRSGQR